MASWKGARPVDTPSAAFVLLLSEQLQDNGMVVYTYSVAPGRRVSLVTRPGPARLPPDHPAVLAEVARIEEGTHGYAGTDHD